MQPDTTEKSIYVGNGQKTYKFTTPPDRHKNPSHFDLGIATDKPIELWMKLAHLSITTNYRNKAFLVIRAPNMKTILYRTYTMAITLPQKNSQEITLFRNRYKHITQAGSPAASPTTTPLTKGKISAKADTRQGTTAAASKNQR